MRKRATSIALGATAALVPLLVAMQSVVADSPDSQAFGQIQNGRYLAIAADCAACHTVPDTGKPFAGGRAIETPFGNIVAPNITPDRDTGIGAWSDDEFDDAVRRGIRPNGARLYPAMPYTAYLKTGHNRMTAATGPMAEMIADSTSQMTDSDLAAIAAYLKSLPGREDNPTPVGANDPFMVAGQAIYRDQCSACHALDGKGVPQLFPSLVDSSLVRSSDPATLIRVVLRGARSVATAAEPTAPGMPSFGWQLDDAQVAAVLTYIRNAGDAAAAPVSADDVSRARAALRGRTD